MSCDLEQVESWVFGELSAELSSEVAAHVDGCAECAREASFLRAERQVFAVSSLSQAREQASLPDVNVVLARSREVPEAPRARVRSIAFASALALAAAACLTFSLAHQSPSAALAPPSPADLAASEDVSGLACFEGDSPAAEEAAYSLRDSIAAAELDYEACLVVTPSSPPRSRHGLLEESSVTRAMFTPLPIEACE